MSSESLPFKLKPEEMVLWRGTPERLPYIGKSLIFTIFGLFLAIPATAVINEMREAPLILLLPPTIVAVIGYLFAIIPPIRSVISYGNVEYFITNQRVIITGGILEKSIRTVDLDEIESVVIRRGFWDRKFGTSTLYLIIRGVLMLPSFSSIRDAERAKSLIEDLTSRPG